jgi:hypothetical protein
MGFEDVRDVKYGHLGLVLLIRMVDILFSIMGKFFSVLDSLKRTIDGY